jgi:hypothetical protein
MMKNLILLLLTTFTLSCCNKDDNTPTNPIDQLPPATQIGANKVGCLVNGEVFLPKGSNPFGSPIVNCHYQYVNDTWNFSLGYSNNQQEHLRGINVASKGVELQQGQTYPLVLQSNNSCYASYGRSTIPQYYTNNINIGELKITKLDQVNNIISGTFWFDAVNSNSEKVEIREGRFDMQYTQ